MLHTPTSTAGKSNTLDLAAALRAPGSGATSTAILSMVRNERDIIETWLPHLLAMFDDIFIADHMSDDGTWDYLSSIAVRQPQVHLFRYREPSYDQHVVLECLRRLCMAECNPDWIFILDADEFLPFHSRAVLDEALKAFETNALVTFHWRNAYPRAPGIRGATFDGFVANQLSSFGKVAMRRSIANDLQYAIPRGAHVLTHVSGRVTEGIPGGELLHFPVRSMDQIWAKVHTGCESYLADSAHDGCEGSHWFELQDSLLRSPSDWGLAHRLVHDYGHPRTPERMAAAENAFEPRTLELAGSDDAKLRGTLALPQRPSTSPAEHVMLRKSFILRRTAAGGFVKQEAVVVADGEIRHLGDGQAKGFGRLVDRPQSKLELGNLADALQASHLDIEMTEPSAWVEHIPFLFSLIALTHPRRYAELGVHHGTSFFAACQAVRRSIIDCECVAIDNWIGDPHAGAHAPSVFEGFRDYLAQHYADTACYLRMDFDKALSQFEDGSVDLLHIDGFHTTNAVRRDFEQWLGKMSEEGVILFHDINEFSADFGVWRFWRTVREKYPSLEFGHGHGLGVLVVGPKSVLNQTVAGANFSLLSSEANELLQLIFGNTGRLTWTLKKLAALQPHHDQRIEELSLELGRVGRAGEQRIGELEASLHLREQRIGELEAETHVREQRIGELGAETHVREQRIGELEAAVRAGEQRIGELTRILQAHRNSPYGRLRAGIRKLGALVKRV